MHTKRGWTNLFERFQPLKVLLMSPYRVICLPLPPIHQSENSVAYRCEGGAPRTWLKSSQYYCNRTYDPSREGTKWILLTAQPAQRVLFRYRFHLFSSPQIYAPLLESSDECPRL